MTAENRDNEGTRQERREHRRRKRMEMRMHGANLAMLYRNAVIKRVAEPSKRKRRRR
jgi:hypothetical protein